MGEYSEECLQYFLENQLQLFDEKVPFFGSWAAGADQPVFRSQQLVFHEPSAQVGQRTVRSEEHTSELQSH